MIDGIHSDYVDGKPGPLESKIGGENLEIWQQLARDAMAGRKRAIVTHSEIFPGTFASTTETADYLLKQLNLARRPVLKLSLIHISEPTRLGMISYAVTTRILPRRSVYRIVSSRPDLVRPKQRTRSSFSCG